MNIILQYKLIKLKYALLYKNVNFNNIPRNKITAHEYPREGKFPFSRDIIPSSDVPKDCPVTFIVCLRYNLAGKFLRQVP